MFCTVSKTFTFDASHRIRSFGKDHKCARMHGHTWKVKVTVAGAVNPETGIVIDYYDIMEAWKPVLEALDHRHLNDVEGLEIPSTENIAAFIWRKMEGPLTSKDKTYKLSRLEIFEGETDSCEFFGAL